MPDKTILLTGIGSLRGDDQVGWIITGQLAEILRDSQHVQVRLATIPLDLLDWIGGVQQLHIIDACQSEHPSGTLHRIEWSDTRTDPNQTIAFNGNNTHDFGVTDTLLLAEQSGTLPEKVILWAIDGKNFELSNTMESQVTASIPGAVNRILAELQETPAG